VTNSSKTFALPANEAHVWHWPSEPDSDDFLALLAPDELARARELSRAADRDRFVRTHAIVRLVLASYTGEPAAKLRLGRRANGKPFLAGHKLFFSLSHSGDVAALALTRAGDIGVDIERRRELPELDVLLRTYRPRNALMPPPSRRTGAFFRWWTAAEAYGKATGAGLLRATTGPMFDRDDRFVVLPFERPPDITGTLVAPAAVEDVHHLDYA
jgi:4'-phosphopantetheinyl transferase